MGELMKNCWLFMPNSVWVVCNKCYEIGLRRKDNYWTQVVPSPYSLSDFMNASRGGKIVIRCKQDLHDIIIQRVWFAREGMREPESETNQDNISDIKID